MRLRKPVRRALIGLATLAALALLTLALPVPAWRTGRGGIEPIALAPAGAYAATGSRVWIDTDAACGAGRRTDPDDCLALLALLRADGLRIAGISTVFGNAPLDVTDRTARELTRRLAGEGMQVPAVRRGLAAAIDRDPAATPAQAALRAALAEAPLVIVALGPLSNIAAVLRDAPALRAHVERLVVVMGQRPGHVFHPAEGGTARMLLGHGPVFRDFNFVGDAKAAATILALGVPLVLVPYEAAQAVEITAADLDAMSRDGAAARWVAAGSRAWLDFWRGEIGQRGFFAFDLVAAAYLLHPQRFRCAAVRAGIEARPWWLRWLLGDAGLFVARLGDEGPRDAPERVIYCPRPDAALHDDMLADLTRSAQR